MLRADVSSQDCCAKSRRPDSEALRMADSTTLPRRRNPALCRRSNSTCPAISRSPAGGVASGASAEQPRSLEYIEADASCQTRAPGIAVAPVDGCAYCPIPGAYRVHGICGGCKCGVRWCGHGQEGLAEAQAGSRRRQPPVWVAPQAASLADPEGTPSVGGSAPSPRRGSGTRGPRKRRFRPDRRHRDSTSGYPLGGPAGLGQSGRRPRRSVALQPRTIRSGPEMANRLRNKHLRPRRQSLPHLPPPGANRTFHS